jgi:DNA-binding transcriptional regulator YiaG
MVWLLNGFALTVDGERELVRYERLGGLIAALHACLLLKPALLSAPEITYLRRALDMSQADLAQVLGTTDQTLSLWERGSHPMARASDTLLRKLCVESKAFAAKIPARQTRVQALSRLALGAGQFMYEGKLADDQWSFEAQPLHQPTRSAKASFALPIEPARGARSARQG